MKPDRSISVLGYADSAKADLGPPEILRLALSDQIALQEFWPLTDGVEWRLGQRYWQERGNKAFLRESVPYVINNDGSLSWNAAGLLFANLLEAEAVGCLPPQIFALELGVGTGLFARYFLDAFRHLSSHADKDYYERLCYIGADRSERMLLDLGRHGVLANHGGHYALRSVDATCRDSTLARQLELRIRAEISARK